MLIDLLFFNGWGNSLVNHELNEVKHFLGIAETNKVVEIYKNEIPQPVF